MKKTIPYGITPIGPNNAVYKLRFKSGCDTLIKEINLLSLSCEASYTNHKGRNYITVQGCIPQPNIQHLHNEILKHSLLRDIKQKCNITTINEIVSALNKEMEYYLNGGL